MASYNFPPDDRRANTINPADLHNDMFNLAGFEAFCAPPDNACLPDLATVDSAVDLTSFQVDNSWTSPAVKLEPTDPPMDQFFELGESPRPSNTPSPSTDMIFSNANSPGDFIRDHSQTSSPETSNDIPRLDAKPPVLDDTWNTMFSTPEALNIPHTIDPPKVYVVPDKTKTRAETQIKVQLILDPLDDRYEHIRFPRKTLAKPKLLATDEERQEIESKGGALHMEFLLVCATAIEKPERREQALRRARGAEPIPRRPVGVVISELDKEDPAHPQNGGEVIICDGCKEREQKRYNRKKKKAEDEREWAKYDDDRVIMVNEKEYKKWKDMEQGGEHSSRAKQVEFAMRIACYCRHQEEKSPVGYKVIFTFKEPNGNLVAQKVSDIFQITDDHKNKEVVPEFPPPLQIPRPYVAQQQYGHTHAPNVVPVYQYPIDGQYSTAMGPYSQPPTPVMSNFQTPISPMDGQFPQSTTPTAVPQPPLQPTPSYNATNSGTTPQYTRHQHQHSYYDIPMLSPTTQVSSENQYLPRPVSMDNFNFSSELQYPQHQSFASAPPSAVSTPINLSRPASPTWEQGPAKRKHLRCFYFYVDDE